MASTPTNLSDCVVPLPVCITRATQPAESASELSCVCLFPDTCHIQLPRCSLCMKQTVIIAVLQLIPPPFFPIFLSILHGPWKLISLKHRFIFALFHSSISSTYCRQALGNRNERISWGLPAWTAHSPVGETDICREKSSEKRDEREQHCCGCGDRCDRCWINQRVTGEETVIPCLSREWSILQDQHETEIETGSSFESGKIDERMGAEIGFEVPAEGKKWMLIKSEDICVPQQERQAHSLEEQVSHLRIARWWQLEGGGFKLPESTENF